LRNAAQPSHKVFNMVENELNHKVLVNWLSSRAATLLGSSVAVPAGSSGSRA
jgi:hypothetical protein